MPYTHRPSASINHAESTARSPSVSSVAAVPTTARYEETAFHRQELEAVKKENEALKRRIRELEILMRQKREEDGRGRSES